MSDIQTITDACDRLIEAWDKAGRPKYIGSEEFHFEVISANTASPIAQALKVCVEALKQYSGQASDRQTGVTRYSEADEALSEAAKLIREGGRHG